MAFNTYSYLLLLMPAVTLFWVLPAAARRWYVFALSAAYYAFWGGSFLVAPLLITGVVYFAARRPRWIWLGIAIVLTMFLFYRTIERESVPVGLSFYSFAAIAYLIDAKQGRVDDTSITTLLRFVLFWPTLTSGPIVRFRELGPQLGFTQRFEAGMLMKGLDRLVLGLVEKNLIANSLSSWVNAGFATNAVTMNTTLDNWSLALAFGLEVYFDFAAYSNMAIGTAQLIGVVLPENFRFPYHAANPADFWNRWHMTLSRWIRDYVFVPANIRFRGAPLPLYTSLLVVMTLVGLWHGFGFGFALWGAMHGAYLVIYRIVENLRGSQIAGRAKSAGVIWGWRIFTLIAVTAAWVPFRAATSSGAVAMLSSMFFRWNFGLTYGANFYLITLLAAVFCMAEPYLGLAWRHAASWMTRHAGAEYALRPLAYALGLVLFLIFDDRSRQFIYSQF